MPLFSPCLPYQVCIGAYGGRLVPSEFPLLTFTLLCWIKLWSSIISNTHSSNHWFLILFSPGFFFTSLSSIPVSLFKLGCHLCKCRSRSLEVFSVLGCRSNMAAPWRWTRTLYRYKGLVLSLQQHNDSHSGNILVNIIFHSCSNPKSYIVELCTKKR